MQQHRTVHINIHIQYLLPTRGVCDLRDQVETSAPGPPEDHDGYYIHSSVTKEKVRSKKNVSEEGDKWKYVWSVSGRIYSRGKPI